MKKIFILFLAISLSSCIPKNTSRYYLLSNMRGDNITLFEQGREKGSWGKQINDLQSSMLYLEVFPEIEIKLYRNRGVVTIHSITASLRETLLYDHKRKLYYNYENKLPITVIVEKKGSRENIKLYMTFMDIVICFHDDI